MLNALIVDDDHLFVSDLKFHMEHPTPPSRLRFATIDVAYTCEDAVRLAQATPEYDLIIYDLGMPVRDGESPSIENGLQMVKQIAPLQRYACGILVVGYIAASEALLVGQVGAVRRIVKKPVGPLAVIASAEEALDEVAKLPNATLERLRANYQLQASIHEAMNNLNNIVAAAAEAEKICRAQTTFLTAKHLPILRREVRNIQDFQRGAEQALRSIHPTQASQTELCDLKRIAAWCIRHLAMKYPGWEDRISVLIDDAVPPTIGVLEELQQILLVLTSNAIKAIGQDEGRVELSIRLDATGRDIVIDVTDNGPGIPLEVRDRLFDPGNSGQGLFLARAFAWNHAGKIRLSQGFDGKGVKVTVILPRRGGQHND